MCFLCVTFLSLFALTQVPRDWGSHKNFMWQMVRTNFDFTPNRLSSSQSPSINTGSPTRSSEPDTKHSFFEMSFMNDSSNSSPNVRVIDGKRHPEVTRPPSTVPIADKMRSLSRVIRAEVTEMTRRRSPSPSKNTKHLLLRTSDWRSSSIRCADLFLVLDNSWTRAALPNRDLASPGNQNITSSNRARGTTTSVTSEGSTSALTSNWWKVVATTEATSRMLRCLCINSTRTCACTKTSWQSDVATDEPT
mmetsp:Transcript_34938/g.93253  ORF Transcript_34938/g.93253 Transcript_34938/m.93253 type:complete len:249 (-) Transcript_34938:103-849(-)